MKRNKNTRFRNVNDFEGFINAIDVDYDSERFFTQWLYTLNTPKFNGVWGAQYGTDFEQDVVDIMGNNCYFPTSGQFFRNLIIHLTGKGYTKDF